MNLSEFINSIQVHAEAYTGFDFIVSTRDQVNTYFNSLDSPAKALIMMDPPKSELAIVAGTLPITYEVQMAFMLHVEQDSTYDERQTLVNIAEQYATDFIYALYVNAQEVTNFEVTKLSNVQIWPEHLFDFNYQNMSGVFLGFTAETASTFNYCQVLNQDFPDPIIDGWESAIAISVFSYGPIIAAIFAAEGDTGVTFLWEKRLSGNELWEVFEEKTTNDFVSLNDLAPGEYEFRMRYRSNGGSLSGYSNILTKTLT